MKTATATPSKVEKLLPALLERSTALTVTTKEEYVTAASFLQEAKGFLLKCDQEFDTGIDQAYQLHKTLVAQKKKYTEPAKQAYAAVNQRRIQFEDIQRREQEAERRRLEEIERKRLEKERDDRAAEAREAGDKKASKEILKEEIVVPEIEVPDTLPDVEVPRTQKRWDIKITDPRAVIKACAAAKPGETAYSAAIPDEVYLRKQAVAQKSAFKVAGAIAFEKVI